MKSSPTLIVNYHYCMDEDENPYLARTAVKPARFAQQIEQLSRLKTEHDIDPLVTFDDGTRDIWLNAIPVLQKYKVPSIIFCCSLPLVERRMLNVTKVHMLQGKLGLEEFRARFMAAMQAMDEPYELEDAERLNLGRLFRYDTEDIREFKFLLNVKLPYPIVTRLLDDLFAHEFGPQSDIVKSIYMSKDDIKRAHEAGARIGLHTHSHFMLARLSAAEQEKEILDNLAFLQDVLDEDDIDLSYPHGVEGTWNQDTKDVMKQHAMKRAYTLGRQIYDPSVHHESFEIPRFDVNDVFKKNGELKTELFRSI